MVQFPVTSAAMSSSEGGLSSHWGNLTKILSVAFGNILRPSEKKSLEESFISLSYVALG